jgi:predicted aldo/keto reductase-like oxidoreductase
MKSSSRRLFLSAGLALPAAGLSTSSSQSSKTSAPADATREPRSRLVYRTLGKTGLKPTAVAFGCMITSDPSVIVAAADQGINYFDTARGYQGGNNERMVGAALKSKRKQLILSSKTPSPTKEGALKDLETSLREIGTDYLDIWYLHAKSRPDQITDDLMEAQRIAKQQGKVRFAGISTHAGHQELIPAVIAAKHFDVLLTSYNFSMDESMNDLIASARKAGIGIVGMKVMAGGFRRIKEGDPLYPKFKREGAHLAMLKWVLRNRNIDTTIPSITDLDQLDQNLRAMTEAWSSADEQLLAIRLEQIRPLYCRMCGACEGMCPKGIPVPDVVRFVSYADGYGEFALGRENYLALPEEHRLCGDCSECAVKCPNGVQVAGRMARAQELFA